MNMKKLIIPLFLSFAFLCNSQISVINLLKSKGQQTKDTHSLSSNTKGISNTNNTTETATNVMPLKFFSDDRKDMRALADSIALNAKRIYKFSREYMVVDSSNKVAINVYRIKYLKVDDSTDSLMFIYVKKIRGENPALEIKGTPYFEFNNVQGKYLDLFPFWKKFIDVNSDIVKSSYGNSNNYKYIYNNMFRFIAEDNHWVIFVVR